MHKPVCRKWALTRVVSRGRARTDASSENARQQGRKVAYVCMQAADSPRVARSKAKSLHISKHKGVCMGGKSYAGRSTAYAGRSAFISLRADCGRKCFLGKEGQK
jgi:hypothetical protein